MGRLKLEWTYTLPYVGLQTTPLVSDGVMYVSGPNRVCALDSRTGREIWCYSRARGTGGTIPGDAAKGANRGVALLGDRVFFATDNAHLICLNRLTGGLMWDVDITVPGAPGRYGSTGAPLVVGDLVITGVSGGDAPLQGFHGRVSSGYRPASLAVLDVAQTRRAWLGDLEWLGARHRGRRPPG